jgi:hypothetical protein
MMRNGKYCLPVYLPEFYMEAGFRSLIGLMLRRSVQGSVRYSSFTIDHSHL